MNISKQNHAFVKSTPIWYIGVIALTALSIISLSISPSAFPLVIIRWISSLIMLLWVPGFCFVRALFPDNNISSVETVTFSVALSIILVIVVGLFCNFTVLGLSEMPILVILSTISLAFATVAYLRQAKSSILDNNKAQMTKHN